jgi:hypothetical protein
MDNYTSSMAFRILKANGQVIVRKTVWSLKAAELDDIKVQADIAVLDEGILSRIGDKASNERNLEEFPEVPIDFFGAEDDDKGLTDDLQEPDTSKPDIDSYSDNKVDESCCSCGYTSRRLDHNRHCDLLAKKC